MAKEKEKDRESSLLEEKFGPKKLLSLLLSKEAKISNWPREMKMAKKLFSLCSNPAFWNSLIVGSDVFTLSFFSTEQGKSILNNHYKKFIARKVEKVKQEEFEDSLVKPTQEIELEQDKVGEDYKVSKKPTNFNDYIKEYRKKEFLNNLNGESL